MSECTTEASHAPSTSTVPRPEVDDLSQAQPDSRIVSEQQPTPEITWEKPPGQEPEPEPVKPWESEGRDASRLDQGVDRAAHLAGRTFSPFVMDLISEVGCCVRAALLYGALTCSLAKYRKPTFSVGREDLARRTPRDRDAIYHCG